MKVNHLTLFLTSCCNMQCSYCYLEHKNENVMSWEMAKKAVDWLCKNNERGSISFFGGEPLLQSDLLFHIADYIRKEIGSSIGLSVTTNGILLTPAIMKKMQEYNVFVVLSLDGYGEDANKHRKLKDGQDYWSILDKNLKQISVRDIGAVRMTVVPESVSELYYNYFSLLSRGFEHVNFALDYTSVWNNEHLETYQSQFAKILQLYLDQIIQERRVCIDFVDNIVLNAIKNKKMGCTYGVGSFAVSANGYVFPCHREVLDIVSDNGVPLEEFIARGFWKKEICVEKQDVVCRECDLYNRCSICMTNLKKMGGSLTDIPELICNVNKIHIFEVDDMIRKLYCNHRKHFYNKYR